jgi:cobalt-zinc-cadmium efflux system membrane fusion protein
MPARLRNLLSMLLGQLPTVLTLALIVAVAAWGYVWDWKVPSLSQLLHPEQAKKPDEGDKKGPSLSKMDVNAYLALVLQNQPFPTIGCSYFLAVPYPHPIPMPSEDALHAAGIDLKNLPRVEERRMEEYVKAYGEIDFDQNHYAHLSTRASGTVWSVHKQEGDEVQKGQVLALVAAPELAQLKFDLQQTLLTVQTRAKLYHRLKSGGETTPPKDLEAAESSLREARIRLSKDQQSLQNLGLTISTDELMGLPDEQVAARLRLLGIPDSLLLELDARTATNNLLPMYAPFDGQVIARDIVKGEVVNPGAPQFVLANPRHLWIRLYVHLEDAGKLGLDQKVFFRLDGSDEDAPPVSITFISAEVDEKTHTVMARAEVDNPRGRLRARNFGEGRILVRSTQQLVVPNEALQFDGTSYFVFAFDESANVFQPLRVTLGTRYDKFTVILSGVKASQSIVGAGSHALLGEMLKEHITRED